MDRRRVICGGIALCGLPFSGLAAGDDLMHASATIPALDGSWISSLRRRNVGGRASRRCGHLLRMGARGRSGGAPKHEEKPETEQGHDHTPATMFIPAAMLVAAGILLGIDRI